MKIEIELSDISFPVAASVLKDALTSYADYTATSMAEARSKTTWKNWERRGQCAEELKSRIKKVT